MYKSKRYEDFVIDGNSHDRVGEFSVWRVFVKNYEKMDSSGKPELVFLTAMHGPMSFIAAAGFVEYMVKHSLADQSAMTSAITLKTMLDKD